MMSIHQREVRFTYHVVPFLIIVSTAAVLELIVDFTRRIVPPRWTFAALAASLLVFASTQIKSDLQGMAGITAMSESHAVKFGNYIAYPADTKILADSYTYLPPSMTNVTFTNLQTEELLNEVAPKALILTRAAKGASVWKKTGTAFSDRKFVKRPATPDSSPSGGVPEQVAVAFIRLVGRSGE
jgi:hypothetical protein